MFRLYFTAAVLLLLCIAEYRKYRYFLAATVLYPVMWILSLIGMIGFGNAYYKVSWVTLIAIIGGYILFLLGFELVYRREERLGPVEGSRHLGVGDDLIPGQMIGIDLVTVVAAMITIMSAASMMKYLDFNDIVGSLILIKQRIDAGEKPFPYVVVVCRYFLRCAIWYLALVYARIPSDTNYKTPDGRNYRTGIFIRLILVACMALIVLFTDISRNDVLMTILPVIFIFLLSKKRNNRQALLILAMCFLGFIVFFILFNFFRGGIRSSWTRMLKEQGEGQLVHYLHYLTCGIPALDQLYQSGGMKIVTINGGGGKYTLSLLGALCDRLFGTDFKPAVLQEIIEIGPGIGTNVYTVYHWLGLDFGLVYAVMSQFLYGMLHGALYHRALKGSMAAVFWYSVLAYPLLMMFFEDQYLAIAQTWLIIFVFVYFIFFVCNKARVRARG